MIKEIEINGKLEKFSFGLGMLGDMLFKLNVGWLKFDEMQAENPFKYTPIKMIKLGKVYCTISVKFKPIIYKGKYL